MRSLYQQRSINPQSQIDRRIITLTTLNTPILLDPFFADEILILVSSDNNANQLQLPEINYQLYKNKIIKISNASQQPLIFRVIASSNQTFNGSIITTIQVSQSAIIQAFNDNIWLIST